MTRRLQVSTCFGIMRDGRWRTLVQIQAGMIGSGVAAPIQSVSSRLRDLRKDQYGAHIVDRRAQVGSNGRVFEYRMRRRQR